MALVGNLSGSSRQSSRIGVTGSVVFAGADPDHTSAFPAMGNDVAFYVSGNVGGKDSLTEQGTSAFGGDLLVSGTLIANRSDDGAHAAIKIDKDYTGTTDVGSLLSGGTDATGLTVDYDVTGIVASGQTAYHDAIAVHYNQDAPTHVGTVNATGADIRMTGGTDGSQALKGVAITLAGADTNTGIDITAPNDSTHFVARSSDHLSDYFKISVGESGATTLSTSDAGASVGHLTLDADGKIIINALGGKEVVFNENSENVDFRVESQNEQNAILVDAGSDVLHVNKGKSAFSTKIWNNSDNALEVNSSGVVINEEGHSANDFRVESDAKTHAIFVDAGNNRVLFLSGGDSTSFNEAAASNVIFYVSGTVDPNMQGGGGAEAVFGGDVRFSGSIRVDGSAAITDDVYAFEDLFLGHPTNHTAPQIVSMADMDTSIDFRGSDRLRIVVGGRPFVDMEENSGDTPDKFLVLSGGHSSSTDETEAGDVAFYVSGAVGGRGWYGASVFGGDTIISGALWIPGTDASAGAGIIGMNEIDGMPNTPPANTGLIFLADNSGTTTPYFLNSSGTPSSMIGGGGGSSPGGSSGQLQYNVGGSSFGGAPVSYDTSSGYLLIGSDGVVVEISGTYGTTVTGSLNVSGSNTFGLNRLLLDTDPNDSTISVDLGSHGSDSIRPTFGMFKNDGNALTALLVNASGSTQPGGEDDGPLLAFARKSSAGNGLLPGGAPGGDGAELMRIHGYGFDGSKYVKGASISMYTTGTVTTRQMPTKLIFSTNDGDDTGSPFPETRMIIHPDGDVAIGTTVKYSGPKLFVEGVTQVAETLGVGPYGMPLITLSGSFDQSQPAFDGFIKPYMGAIKIMNNNASTILELKGQGGMFGSPDETLVVSGTMGGKPYQAQGTTTFTGDVVISGSLYSPVEAKYSYGASELDIKDEKFIMSHPDSAVTKSVVLPSLTALPAPHVGGGSSFQGWEVKIIHIGAGKTAITTDDPSSEYFMSGTGGTNGTQIVLEAASHSVTLVGYGNVWFRTAHTD